MLLFVITRLLRIPLENQHCVPNSNLTPELSGGGETTTDLRLNHRVTNHRCPPVRLSDLLERGPLMEPRSRHR
jgi:hypothetical protein